MSKEAVGHVARQKDALDAQIHPSLREIGQINAPVLLALIDMGFVGKPIDTITDAQEAFMIMPIMFIGDF
jgi:hypothetical protein